MSSQQYDNGHHDEPVHDICYNNSDYDYNQDQAQGFNLESRSSCCSGGGCCLSGCCLGCLGFILLIALCIFGVWYCVFTGSTPLAVSPETTIITEPLKADGTVDFHRAIKGMLEPDIDANANGFRDVLAEFGEGVFMFGNDFDESIWQYRAMCESLGIEFLPGRRLSFNNLDEQQTNAALDAVQTAATKPHYFVPLVRRGENDLVATSLPFAACAFHGALSDALRQRAAAQFNSDVDGAWKDMLTSIRLFRRVTIHQAWSKSMAAREYESLLTPVSNVVATLKDWTPEQLTQAIKDLESLPAWEDRQTTLKVMQFTVLDGLSVAHNLPELLRRFGSHDLPDTMPPETLQAFGLIAFDWNFFAIAINTIVKRYSEALDMSEGSNLDEQFRLLRLRKADEPPYLVLDADELRIRLERNIAATDDFSLNPFVASGRSKLFGMIVGEMVVDAAGEMYRFQIMEESRCQALRLALALERYHREHGNYPDSLEQLGILPILDLRYEKRGSGYLIANRAFRFQLEREQNG